MTKKKKIGIITFSNTFDNYGQVLQYLATQEYLTKRGHGVYLYQSLGHKPMSIFRIRRKLRKILKRVLGKGQRTNASSELPLKSIDAKIIQEENEKRKMFQKWAEITQRNENEHPRHFEEFRSRYFHVLKIYYEDLKGFDSFAIGSDQMWSFLTEDTMLDFVPSGIHRFSIAPSVGHKVFTTDEIKRATKSLSKFDFITVREQNGLDFCHACGRDDAQLVLDPTFLLNSEDYSRFVDSQGLQLPKRYVFLYLLGGEINTRVQEIFTWAKTNGLEVVYVASQGREDEYSKCYATVEQWLYAIKNAEYVFTNSYHGMALSIIYRKPFLIFPLVGIMKGMNGRIQHLAKIYNLEDRLYMGDFDAVVKPIDWQYTERTISHNNTQLDNLLKTIYL